MKRDLINEIKAIKERTELNSRHEIISRLDTIEAVIRGSLKIKNDFGFYGGQAQGAFLCLTKMNISDAEHDKELLKFIPIATIACVESFFGSIIKELIDFGKPFSDNVVKFNQAKNVKFDFDIINAIQARAVTVGEFVSHILPCNSFDDINSNISILTGLDFADSIKKFNKRSLFESEDEDDTGFLTNSSQIIADLKGTFELRNIFCHEFGNNIKIFPHDILRCFKNSRIFLNHTNDFIWDLLYPNSPLTQIEMSGQAANDFEKIESELSELVMQIKLIAPEHHDLYFDETLFESSISQWKIYRDAKAKSDSAGYEGGSIYSMIYDINLTNITKEKIESLKREFETCFRRYNSR